MKLDNGKKKNNTNNVKSAFAYEDHEQYMSDFDRALNTIGWLATGFCVGIVFIVALVW